MNQLDQILTAIASEHLGIPTLGTRNSDSLDFYDIPVWGIVPPSCTLTRPA